MEVRNFHRWDVTVKEAISLQRRLASRVIRERTFRKVSSIAGVDASYKGGKAQAAIVVLSYPDLKLVGQGVAELPVSFPYVPGLLAFREGPAVVEAFRALKTEPDLIIFDAQGLAHPRRLGFASHLGVILNKPSIGCAKSRLIGEPAGRLSGKKWSFVNLVDKGEVIGSVLRSKSGGSPLFVSIGHRIDLVSSVDFVLSCVEDGARLPKTTLLAHELAGLA